MAAKSTPKTKSAKTTTAKTAANKKWQSRAVVRPVDAGNSAYCAVCGELIKFRARVRANQIICNVYLKNQWDRVEHFHPECYETAENPYGEAAE